MSRNLLALGIALCVALIPANAHDGGTGEYIVEFDPHGGVQSMQDHAGKKGLYVDFRFRILRGSDPSVATHVPLDEIVVTEDGQPVSELVITPPEAKSLTTVLVLDISGSMSVGNKMTAAKNAARVFLGKLDERADTGLILFDHRVQLDDPKRVRRPVGNRAQAARQRDEIRKLIDAAKPDGGTAYLDATAEAVRMLEKADGNKAVVLMTDGRDVNSRLGLDDVLSGAIRAGVPIFTIGIGEPGKNESMSTVLVLDHSGSMSEKAAEGDDRTKIVALKEAARRFVKLIPDLRRDLDEDTTPIKGRLSRPLKPGEQPRAWTTLLPFSDTIAAPGPFTNDEKDLKKIINALEPRGGTRLYDATYAGIETLMAANPQGKRAVLVLTDGVDESPGSRVSDRDVIDRARKAKIPLYMLGLGRPEEINEPAMKRMAERTGGKYFHVGSEKTLIATFEDLSIALHDDGIDETSLRELATRSGGRYYPAKDVSKLTLIYEQLADELQTMYHGSFRSPRNILDGTNRDIKIRVQRAGKTISNIASGAYGTRGVVPAQMDSRVYLGMLVVLGLLLCLPSMWKRRQGDSSSDPRA